MATPPIQPEILVYKEIGAGDFRKLRAESNDSQSGGGARDLRFPWKAFQGVMAKLFTQEAMATNGTHIRVGTFAYRDGQQSRTTKLEYWPPTASRPSEGRIAKVHESPAIGGKTFREDRGRVFLVFIRWSDGQTSCYPAYEDDLKEGTNWRHDVRSAILGCLAATDLANGNRANGGLSVQGYVDFQSGDEPYCHGA